MSRFYRALLRLYPASFRDEYREELIRAFEGRRREIVGPLAPLRTVIAALTDVVPNALAVHGDILRQDLVYTSRSLRRSPAFAWTAVLVAALGVGANTAVFSVADFVFVRPLPFREPDRLLKLWEQPPGGGRNEVSPANFRDWRQSAHSFSEMAAYTFRSANLVSTREPRELSTVLATPELFPLLGVPPLLGRVFSARDLESGQTVVLSYGLWQSHFGGDPHLLGTSVRLNGVPHTVIGVMPASFQFPNPSIEAWTMLSLHESDFADRTDTYLNVIARQRPGASVERAKQEMALLSAQLERQYPKENHDVRALVLELRDEVTRRSRMLVLALCGAALCILLLACANLASLFLARGTHRAPELAVRAALGAGRERLIRQLITESLVVSFVGGLVGVLAAALILPVLARMVPDTLPMSGRASLDLRVMGFAGVLVVVTGLVFGLAPALQAGRTSGLAALGTGSRTTGSQTKRLRAGLVVVEVAASVVLLVSCGLLIRTVWRIQSLEPGFHAEHVLTLRTALPEDPYAITADRVRFYRHVLDALRTSPGVRSAAYATGLPMDMRGGIWEATVAGEEDAAPGSNDVSVRYITPQYFATLGIPLRRGRDVAETDARGQPFAAVVSESFAKRHWPNQDPIGRRFKVAFDERTVVGVVGDVRVRGLEVPSEPQVYLPYQQVGDSSLIGYIPRVLVLRTVGPLEVGGLTATIRRIVQSADVGQPISHVRTMADLLSDDTAPRVTQIRLLLAMSALALLIAGSGIHGLLAFSVSVRSRELGIRRALGAQSGHIVRLVLGEGLVLALIGIAVGLLVGQWVARGMGALLIDVRPSDPVAVATAGALCLATSILGCLRPTLTAARVDPMTAMRAE